MSSKIQHRQKIINNLKRKYGAISVKTHIIETGKLAEFVCDFNNPEIIGNVSLVCKLNDDWNDVEKHFETVIYSIKSEKCLICSKLYKEFPQGKKASQDRCQRCDFACCVECFQQILREENVKATCPLCDKTIFDVDMLFCIDLFEDCGLADPVDWEEFIKRRCDNLELYYTPILVRN